MPPCLALPVVTELAAMRLKVPRRLASSTHHRMRPAILTRLKLSLTSTTYARKYFCTQAQESAKVGRDAAFPAFSTPIPKRARAAVAAARATGQRREQGVISHDDHQLPVGRRGKRNRGGEKR